MSRQKVVHREFHLQKAEFSGPLPPPQILEKYETVLPGAAERVFAMAEKQAVHRQALEKKVIDSDALQALVGTVFGLVIGLFGLGSAVYCIILGHDWAGVGIGGATLVSMVSAFIYGTSQRRRESKGQLPAPR